LNSLRKIDCTTLRFEASKRILPTGISIDRRSQSVLLKYYRHLLCRRDTSKWTRFCAVNRNCTFI